MKLICSLGFLAFALGLLGPRGALAQADPGPSPEPALLIVAVGDSDLAAAARLDELLDQPVETLRMAEAREPRRALPLLVTGPARQALVLDTELARAHVLERDGRVRTRVVERGAAGAPTPFQMAFVASELWALGASRQAGQRLRLPRVARAVGELGIDGGSVYRGSLLVRPALGLSLWLKGRAAPRRYPLLGFQLVGPGAERRRTAELDTLIVERWDKLLRAGIVRPLGRLHAALYSEARAGFNRARYTGPFGGTERAISLGAGAGAALTVQLTPWLGLYCAVGAGYQPRRSRYQVQGESTIGERPLLVVGTVGLSVLGPLRQEPVFAQPLAGAR